MRTSHVEVVVVWADARRLRGVDGSSATRATRANPVGTGAQRVRLKKQGRSRIPINQSMLAHDGPAADADRSALLCSDVLPRWKTGWRSSNSSSSRSQQTFSSHSRALGPSAAATTHPRRSSSCTRRSLRLPHPARFWNQWASHHPVSQGASSSTLQRISFPRPRRCPGRCKCKCKHAHRRSCSPRQQTSSA